MYGIKKFTSLKFSFDDGVVRCNFFLFLRWNSTQEWSCSMVSPRNHGDCTTVETDLYHPFLFLFVKPSITLSSFFLFSWCVCRGIQFVFILFDQTIKFTLLFLCWQCFGFTTSFGSWEDLCCFGASSSLSPSCSISLSLLCFSAFHFDFPFSLIAVPCPFIKQH